MLIVIITNDNQLNTYNRTKYITYCNTYSYNNKR